MNTTVQTIADLKRNAEAERAYAATGAKGKNPWSGSAEKLAASEAQHECESLRAKGELLAKAFADYAALDEEIAALHTELASLKSATDALESRQTVVRWRQAPQIAAVRGWGQNWTHFSAAFEAGRTGREMGIYACPNSDWPIALQFNDDDRAVLKKWREAQQKYEVALHGRMSAENRRAALLTRFPELQGLTLGS